MAIRGDLLKREMEAIDEYQEDDDIEAEVKGIATAARLEALDAVGVR
jgi:hypothetical protein